MRGTKKSIVWIGVWMALIIFVCVPPVSAAGKAKTKSIKIEGTVIEMGKDKKGNINSVGVQTFDGEKYLVSQKGKGKDLMKMINKMVEVRGTVKNSQAKTKVIKISKYKVLTEKKK
jgi:hypothetical protein